ncbi:MAG: TlpA disulfide reductase family protein [Pseudomonadota bacterium]
MSRLLMMRARAFARLLAFTAALSLVAIQPANAGMELHDTDGQIVDLDDYTGNGKWLLVMLWSTSCHICEAQKPSISAFHTKHKDIDAQVLGVAIDGMGNIDAIKKNMETHKTSFPSLVGELVIVASHYQGMTEEALRGTPTYLLFDPQGELVGNNPGPLRIEAIEQFMARHAG